MERQFWIDNLKGFCLFLIIIGHMGRIPALVGVIIHPTDLFYVTSFFFLSGWLFRDENYSSRLRLIQASIVLHQI